MKLRLGRRGRGRQLTKTRCARQPSPAHSLGCAAIEGPLTRGCAQPYELEDTDAPSRLPSEAEVEPAADDADDMHIAAPQFRTRGLPGQVKEIKLVDFMCHEHLVMTFGCAPSFNGTVMPYLPRMRS